MSSLGIAPLSVEAFAIEPDLDDTRLLLRVTGNGDMAAAEPLDRYLKLVHKEALRVRVKEVAVNLCELYFMNSSCLKSFVTWIDTLSTVVDRRYKIRLIGSPKLVWQRRTLDVLQRLGPSVVNLEF
jgi:hypothetical protein